jgi:1-hydroxycarotenoid 3,4-desaturase
MSASHVVVVGAGIGGLSATLELLARGVEVTVLERAAAPGGKLRSLPSAAGPIDAGPTVFTMRWVFEELFAAAGSSLEAELELVPAGLLARHAWSATERLDLFASIERSAAAIGEFAGAREARGYLDFCAQARRTYRLLEAPFLRAPRPSTLGLVRDCGFAGLPEWLRIWPFASLWRRLQRYFRDPRLLQLFGRYATYCGTSPFDAPATLMLVAHVEQDGVWLLGGGMHRLATTLAALAARRGATLRYGTGVEHIHVEQGRATAVELGSGERIEGCAVIVNGDPAALAAGYFGPEVAGAVPALARADRSLSAVTWTLATRTEGFPLQRHSVFFSRDYAAEFRELRAGALPTEPTVYVCAQDRDASGHCTTSGPERLLCLVNAPPTGDFHHFDPAEIDQCATRTQNLLNRCGLRLERFPEEARVTTPSDFQMLFPGTGGGLYGAGCLGSQAAFRRAATRTAVPGLYLAGGSTHPGPGVPMAALSGRLAARTVFADLDSTCRSRRAAIAGGTSMR